ncbi:MAG: MATE family efflux transporter [Ruminococcaceae bacterium]|nr:MATE family efflux transporter [Oscillospiraceae bacterium]
MNKKNEIDMCSGPILGKLLKLAIPMIISSVLQLLFNAADIIVVGNFGSENSVAAVGSTSSLVMLITNLFIGLSISANVLTSKYIGAKDYVKTSKTVHTSVFLSIVSGVILNVIGFFFSGDMLKLMDSPDEVIELSTLYLRIYFFGMIAMMIYNFGSSILRSKGDTKRPLLFLTISGVVNVVLNLVFVIIFNMDVAGVALATVISQWISAILILICLFKEEAPFKLSIKNLLPDARLVRLILRIGIPAGLQGVLFSVANVILQSFINGFGPVTMAGCAAAGSIEAFAWVAMSAVSQAGLTFVSQNMGAGKFSRINRIALISCSVSGLIGLVFGNLTYLFGPQLIALYDPRPEVVEPGMNRLFMICCFYFTCGLMDTLVGNIRGMGYSVMPTVVSLLGVCGIRILWAYTVFQIPVFHNEFVLFMSYPISWALTFVAHLICYLIVRKKYPKKDLCAVK